jgi:hypothetical protein
MTMCAAGSKLLLAEAWSIPMPHAIYRQQSNRHVGNILLIRPETLKL